MRHRTDIDGLRAIAVLPIVLFHAGVSSLGGGFIGVDIFFVISGFLITGIILREIEEKRFTLADFYKRRVVRIIPALSIVVIATLLVGSRLLLPNELKGLGVSAAASAGFVANILFWRKSGYFDTAAETKPLLHLWSLGVEEQFYIFYPLGILILARISPKVIRPVIALGVAGSFAIGWAAMANNASAAFYLLPARAWELGLGAAVAVGLFPKSESVPARNILAWIGLALIAVGVVYIRSDSGFPVPWAALPVVGTALVIIPARTASSLSHRCAGSASSPIRSTCGIGR